MVKNTPFNPDKTQPRLVTQPTVVTAAEVRAGDRVLTPTGLETVEQITIQPSQPVWTVSTANGSLDVSSGHLFAVWYPEWAARLRQLRSAMQAWVEPYRHALEQVAARHHGTDLRLGDWLHAHIFPDTVKPADREALISTIGSCCSPFGVVEGRYTYREQDLAAMMLRIADTNDPISDIPRFVTTTELAQLVASTTCFIPYATTNLHPASS